MAAVDRFKEFYRFGSILGLDRIKELLRRLGNPQKDLEYIHITGTNGKGSVSKYLEKGLESCGYKMGLYTSPYIEKFNERIQCGGSMITDDELERLGNIAIGKAEEMVSDGLTSPTEFEVVMATAFLYFREKKPDIVILESGMGGIGDATNVIEKPLASVITNVTYDHMDRLGNTLAEIALDKSGIIKAGCPVISNVDIHEPAAVIARKAYEMNSRLYDVSKIDFSIDSRTPLKQTVSMELWGTDYSDVVTSMTGRHQAENLKTALAVIEVLRKAGKIKVERSRLYKGLEAAVQPGRFEVMTGSGSRPVVVIDGAHNEAGAGALSAAVRDLFPGYRTLFVTGMLADKQIDKVIEHFTKVADDFIATAPDYEQRALSADEMASRIRTVTTRMEQENGISSNLNSSPDDSEQIKSAGDNAPGEARKKPRVLAIAKTPAESVETAKKYKDDYDLIVFAGSLYLIGEIRSILTANPDYDSDRTLKR